MNQQCCLVSKATSLPDYVRQSAASRSMQVILPLCSALMRAHLELGALVQFWTPQHGRYMETLKRVQQRATKVLKGLESSMLRGEDEKLGTFQSEQEKGGSYHSL